MENSASCLPSRSWLPARLPAQSPVSASAHTATAFICSSSSLLDCDLNILEHDPSVTSFFPCTPFSTLLLQ